MLIVMARVKVVFFADILIDDFDGASRTMFQIINRIPSDNFEFLFVCGMGSDKISGFKCLHVSSLGIPGNKTYRLATPMFQKAELDKEINAFYPDIIHISTPSLLGNYALKLAKRMGIPVVSIYHTNFVSYIDYYIKNVPFLIDFTKDRARNILKAFYNQCDTVYVPSATMMDELSSFGIRAHNMKLWQRGIDKKLFSPTKRKNGLMRSLVGNDNPCILFVSRLVWEKNLQTMIDLYSLIEANDLKYNIVVVGDGVAKAALKKQMPNAFFFGYMGHEQLANIYASSDVFFFPSVTETFGNVVLEAMASGLPCVVANSGGSKDFIRDGVNGFRCSPYNSQEYLGRITEIISRPGLAKTLSENALAASKKYVWENIVAEYFGDLKMLSLKISVS